MDEGKILTEILIELGYWQDEPDTPQNIRERIAKIRRIYFNQELVKESK